MKRDRILLSVVILLISLNIVLRIEHLLPYCFALFLLFTLAYRRWHVLHFALLFLLMNLNSYYFPAFMRHLPVVSFLAPLLISTFFILPFFGLRAPLSWAGMGGISPVIAVVILSTGLLSSAALVLWAKWSGNIDASIRIATQFSALPRWLFFVIAAPLFAVCNAFAEEAVYRGVLQETLSRVFDRRLVILILQASAFAAAHYEAGFPNGISGYLMVIIYGLVLGDLRIRTGGMLAPFLTHVLADLTIGYYVGFIVFS